MNGLYHLFSLFSPDFDADGIVDDALSTLQLKSSWTPNVNAGGSRNNFELFATNPKFKLTVIHQSNQVTNCLCSIIWQGFMTRGVHNIVP